VVDGARARRAWTAVVLWLVFQLTLTSLPGQSLPPWPGWRIDWVAHFCLYFGLGALVARALLLGGRPARVLPLAWLAIVVFGVLDELHEKLIPGRGAELGDLVMDGAGAAFGLAVATLLARSRWSVVMR
jgi:VanZ family protein